MVLPFIVNLLSVVNKMAEPGSSSRQRAGVKLLISAIIINKKHATTLWVCRQQLWSGYLKDFLAGKKKRSRPLPLTIY